MIIYIEVDNQGVAMSLSAKKQHQVLEILTKSITTKPMDWCGIVAAVESEVKVSNWLDVRGIIQYMRNKNIIDRVDSVHVEQYFKVA